MHVSNEFLSLNKQQSLYEKGMFISNRFKTSAKFNSKQAKQRCLIVYETNETTVHSAFYF